jgi:hypothetical protein
MENNENTKWIQPYHKHDIEHRPIFHLLKDLGINIWEALDVTRDPPIKVKIQNTTNIVCSPQSKITDVLVEEHMGICSKCFWLSNCVKSWDHTEKHIVFRDGCYLLNQSKCFQCHYLDYQKGADMGLQDTNKRNEFIAVCLRSEQGENIHGKSE